MRNHTMGADVLELHLLLPGLGASLQMLRPSGDQAQSAEGTFEEGGVHHTTTGGHWRATVPTPVMFLWTLLKTAFYKCYVFF